jgi:hypothetical protein
VLKPSSLAADILEEIEEAREQYAPPLPWAEQGSSPALSDDPRPLCTDRHPLAAT